MTVYDTSDKTSEFSKKPRIKKGYYPGQVLEIKPLAKADGTEIIGTLKDGKTQVRKLVILFQLYQADRKTPVTVTNGNVTTDVVLARVGNVAYKKTDEKEWSTAFTPKSQITADFKALTGTWNPGKPIDTDNYVGKWAELNVDDYDAKEQDGTNTYKASYIKDIAPLTDESSSDPAPVVAQPPKVDADVRKQIEIFATMRKDGLMSEAGLNMALDSLRGKYGADAINALATELGIGN